METVRFSGEVGATETLEDEMEIEFEHSNTVNDNILPAVESLKDSIKIVLSEVLFQPAVGNEGKNILNKIISCSADGLLLCLRLYGRTQLIFRQHELERLTSSKNDCAVMELECLGILENDINGFEIKQLLESLSRAELQLLASKYNINNFKKLRVSELVAVMLKVLNSKSSLSSYFGRSVETASQMKNQISKVLGRSWHLEKSCLRSISAVLWLAGIGADCASMNVIGASSVEAQLKRDLYDMTQVRRYEVVYPSYLINRQSPLYRDPNELQQYLNLLDQQLKLEKLIANKEILNAYKLFSSMKDNLLSLITDLSRRRLDLPSFLRRFTSPYRALRIMMLGIDLLERQRYYAECVTLLRLLLCNAKSTGSTGTDCPIDDIGPCLVGRLLVRLLLDEGHHLRRPRSAIDFVINLLASKRDINPGEICKCLKAGNRLSVQNQLNKTFGLMKKNEFHRHASVRASKSKRRRETTTTTSVSCQPDPQLTEFTNVDRLTLSLLPALKMAAEMKITAPVNATSREIGAHRPHYIWTETVSSVTDSPTMCTSPRISSESHTLLLTVEQWTVKYYTTRLEYEYGIHCESRAYHLLFLLLFYDILYESSPPDVFYSLRQAAPLDLFSDAFYENRRQAVDDRLQWILAVNRPSGLADQNVVGQLIDNRWAAHYGERCLWVDWDLFTKPDRVTELFWCLGPKVVHAICRKLATDFRSWRSGLPDLVVWSPRDSRAKIVEVKGPGDQLSDQQIMWLDTLVRAGADVEVCHISGIPMKSIKAT